MTGFASGETSGVRDGPGGAIDDIWPGGFNPEALGLNVAGSDCGAVPPGMGIFVTWRGTDSPGDKRLNVNIFL